MAPFAVDNDEVNRKDYWVLRVSGLEWNYMVHKMIREHKLDEKAPTDLALLTTFENGALVFFLKKRFVPTSAMVRMTGMSLDALERLDVIKLSVAKRDLPEPTVAYWGEA